MTRSRSHASTLARPFGSGKAAGVLLESRRRRARNAPAVRSIGLASVPRSPVQNRNAISTEPRSWPSAPSALRHLAADRRDRQSRAIAIRGAYRRAAGHNRCAARRAVALTREAAPLPQRQADARQVSRCQVLTMKCDCALIGRASATSADGASADLFVGSAGYGGQALAIASGFASTYVDRAQPTSASFELMLSAFL
jgi:hypothetical protein